MGTKNFFRKTFNLMAIVYTIASAIIVIGALMAGADETGMMKVTDVKTHLFLFLFSFFSALSISIAKTPGVSSVKYLVEGGGMALSFLLFVVLPKANMKFVTAIGWVFGFICAYALTRIVISILVFDESSTKKKVKKNKKAAKEKAKKTREDALYGKSKQPEAEYTSLFSSDKKDK